MLRVEKVATPFTAVTILVPESVPPAGLVPSAMVIEPPKLVTVTPASSCAATRTAGEIVLPAMVLLGWTVKTRCGGGGGGVAAGLNSKFFVPVGSPRITFGVALLRIQLATTSDDASPNVALYNAATAVTCGAANEVPDTTFVVPLSQVDLISSPGA